MWGDMKYVQKQIGSFLDVGFIVDFLLQNIISFIGLFCKRDLYFEGAY
jgi:hypothetical protein